MFPRLVIYFQIKTTAMKNTIVWGAVILLALIVVFLINKCWTPPPPVADCSSNAICPTRPANILERGIIIELKNFYTFKDLTGERDSFQLWKCPTDSVEGQDSSRVNFPFVPLGGGCVLDTIFYTGEEAFLKALNHVLVGKGQPWKINYIAELKFEH